MNSRLRFFACVCGLAFVVSTVDGKDWAQWRGPSGNGVADAGQQPLAKWGEETNVLWKVPVAGRGHSSPIVVGDQLFLQTANEQAQTQSVISFDKATGKQLWQTEVSKGGFPGTIHPKNTHASPTPACNGSQIFASFCHHDSVQLTSLSTQGKILWQKIVGPFKPTAYKYGYAPSPALYKALVIVAADFDGGGYLAAFDQETGNPKWKTNRQGKISYSSPIVAKVGGRDQLLISGCDEVTSYDPSTGQQLWATPGTTMATCGTMVWDGDIVFASGGYPNSETLAVDAGSGRVLWRNRAMCYEQSMLATNGFLYAVTDGGVAYCWNAKTGAEMWKARMSGPISASPVLANGLIYQSNERGTTWVFAATPDGYNETARNQLGEESFATPTIIDNKIYIRVAQPVGGRRQEFLYCIGK